MTPITQVKTIPSFAKYIWLFDVVRIQLQGCLRQIDQKNSDIVITGLRRENNLFKFELQLIFYSKGSDSLDRSNLWSIKAKQLSPVRCSLYANSSDNLDTTIL